jgi:hypothetical protein
MEDADLAELDEPAEQAQFAAFAARVLPHCRAQHSLPILTLLRFRALPRNAFGIPSLREGSHSCLSRPRRYRRLTAFHAACAVAPRGANGGRIGMSFPPNTALQAL